MMLGSRDHSYGSLFAMTTVACHYEHLSVVKLLLDFAPGRNLLNNVDFYFKQFNKRKRLYSLHQRDAILSPIENIFRRKSDNGGGGNHYRSVSFIEELVKLGGDCSKVPLNILPEDDEETRANYLRLILRSSSPTNSLVVIGEKAKKRRIRKITRWLTREVLNHHPLSVRMMTADYGARLGWLRPDFISAEIFHGHYCSEGILFLLKTWNKFDIQQLINKCGKDLLARCNLDLSEFILTFLLSGDPGQKLTHGTILCEFSNNHSLEHQVSLFLKSSIIRTYFTPHLPMVRQWIWEVDHQLCRLVASKDCVRLILPFL